MNNTHLLNQSQRQTARWLWILLGLFCFRVCAQLFQCFFETAFLPPFAAWQSGLLPYGVVRAQQI